MFLKFNRCKSLQFHEWKDKITIPWTVESDASSILTTAVCCRVIAHQALGKKESAENGLSKYYVLVSINNIPCQQAACGEVTMYG